jgi:hypothetical protein
MEITTINEFKYHIQDDSGKIYSIISSKDKKFYRCNCAEFHQKNNCPHIEVLIAYLSGQKIKIKKAIDPYSWLQHYERQFRVKLGFKDASNNRNRK